MANTTPMQQLGLMDIDDGDRNNTEHARKRAKLHESTDVPTFGDEELRNNPSNQSLSIVHAPQGTDSPLVASIAAGPPVVSSSSNVDTPMPIRSPEENQEPSVIFLANLPKVVVKTPLPVLEDRIERTEQLVYCNTLLLQAERARNTTNNVMQIESTLTEKELEWLTEMDKNPMEKEHIRSLPTVMVEEFIQGGVKDSIEIAEIVSLAPVLDRENYRNLLSHFIESFEDAHSLNVDILHGLVQLVQSALPGYLTSDDFVRIVGIFRIHLQGTHKQQLEHTFHLTLAMSRILDIMTERRAKDPYRTEECELLYGVLLGLDSTSDPHLMYQVCYALQALQYVSGEEAALQAVLHHSTNDVAGLANDSAAFELDIGVVFEGLVNLQGTLTGVIDTAAADYGGANSLLESGRGILESLKEGLGSGQIRPWYLAIRAASALAKARQLKDLSQLIYEAPCRCDPFFQWGICQLLGEIASDTIWDTIVRRQAINHLGELYKNDAKAEWGQDESVKFWMLNIISRLGTVEDQGIKEAAHSLLQELKHDQDTAPSIPFPLSNRFPVPKFSPTLARVQNIPYVEYYLHKLRLLQLEEHRRGIYVSLLAKPNLHANNDTCFPLMEKAMEFLAGHCQVFLLLGDSGAGKSTFSRELEHTLWKNYSKGEPIPLYINLSYIDDPSQELIEKHLRYFNFSSEEIQEMKVQREFVLICDGYDEIQLKINLYSKNLFNQLGQWKVKMVVSCRSQYLGKDYRLWFQPQQSDRYQRSTTNLLEEAVIAPFSRDQVREYVEEHVHRRHAIDPLQVQSSWAVEEYMDKLINIPNLMDLVSNPFLLTLALDSLPSVVESEKELSMIRITRVQLYDSFTVRWLKVNHARLKEIQLSETERSELNSLADGNFLHHGIQFQKDLSTAIFMVHNGNPVIEYIPLRDKGTWKAKFFAAGGQARLFRESSTVMRRGAFFHFLHRSLLEYFYSRTIYDPRDYNTGTTSNGRQPTYDPRACLAQMSIVDEPSIVQFLAERVQQDAYFQQQLLETIEESKTDISTAFTATNSITILVRANIFFNGADLRGVKIPGADLSGGQFDSAKLQGADLKGVKLLRSWLRLADMSDANMEGVQFGELPYLEMNGRVYSCAYSPDGRMLGVGLGSTYICIYDTSTWTKRRYLKGHSGSVNSIMFSPDNQRLVSGSGDETVRLWDTESGKNILVMRGHRAYVHSVTIAPCGDRIASASYDRTVRLWNAQTGEMLFVMEGHTNSINSVKYSPDGSQLVSSSRDGTTRFWDSRTGEPGSILNPCYGVVYCVAYSPDGQWVVTGHKKGQLQLWDALTLEPGPVFSGHTSFIRAIDFSSDGRSMTTSSDDKTVRLWDTSTSTLIAVLTGHNTVVNCVAFSPDGHIIASGDCDNKVRLWELDSNWSNLNPRNGCRMKTLAYSHDGQIIFLRDKDGVFHRWDSATGIPVPISYVMPEQWAITSWAHTSDGSQLAFGYNDGSIRLWNCHTGTAGPVLEENESFGDVEELFYSPCCRWLVSVDKVNSVRLWDLHDVEQPPFHVDIGTKWETSDTAVVFSSTGCQFAIHSGEDGIIYIFDTQFREFQSQLDIEDYIWSAVFSPNDQEIAIGALGGCIYLWDLQSKEPSAVLELNGGEVRSIAYSTCGQWMASVSFDKRVRIWHRQFSDGVESWSKMYSINALFDIVDNVAWRPVAPMELVTSTINGTVQVWRMSIDEGGKIVFKMFWGSNLRTLCAEGIIYTNARGLSLTHQTLLAQRSAISPFDKLMPSQVDKSSHPLSFLLESKLSCS